MHGPQRRYRQLDRVLLLVELLAPLRHGATLRELHQDVTDCMGEICDRTLRRDLEALQAMGIVDRVRGSDSEPGAHRWLWRGKSYRAQVLRSMVA